MLTLASGEGLISPFRELTSWLTQLGQVYMFCALILPPQRKKKKNKKELKSEQRH